MNCAQCEAIIVDIARGQADVARARAHIAGCTACFARLESERRLTAGLRDLAGELRQTAVPVGIEQRVLAQFGARQAATRRVAGGRLRRALRWGVAGALAASIVICLAIVATRSMQPSGQAAIAQHRAAPHPEIMTPFYRVHGANRLAGSRGLVRIRMPRATLAVFGLPFNPRRADPITADLLVDNVGIVKAVRFVQ